MFRFLILYFLIYSLMHGYVFYHACHSLRCGRKLIGLATLYSLFMVVAPVLVRLAERNGLETAARVLAYTAFTWMGILLLFIAVAVFFDVFAAGKWLVLKLRHKPAVMTDRYRRQRFLTQLVLVLAMYGYGLYEANHIRTIHLTITSPKIAVQTGKFRIVQISDVHLGLIVREARLARILARVKEAAPDLLVSTGDLVDGQLNDLTGAVKMFEQVRPRYGKLAVTGNHEAYAGLSEALKITREAGFRMLRDEAVSVNGVAFVGVDDPAVEKSDGKKGPSEQDLLRRQKRNTFTVLLKHRPVVDPGSVGLFDIQLSGHTHGGQIFPYNLFPWLTYRYKAGLNTLAYGDLYISNGSGTWGPPIRFGAPPEITVIDLVPGN